MPSTVEGGQQVNDIQTIISTLFESNDIIELRCIRKGGIIQKWTLAQDLPSLADELHAMNQQGYNIYYGPNPRKGFGLSGDKNVALARCLFCDFDHLDPGDGCGRLEFVWNDIFLAGLPDPTLAVNSGHGLHVYWRLSEPMLNLVEWHDTQARLNERLGADPTIKNPERIMRLPGFSNVKEKPYQDCFICWSPIDANR
ncbi:MAG: DNA-primase RepB domain-containing protein [Anaerohalosphaeraceae bacterium]